MYCDGQVFYESDVIIIFFASKEITILTRAKYFTLPAQILVSFINLENYLFVTIFFLFQFRAWVWSWTNPQPMNMGCF